MKRLLFVDDEPNLLAGLRRMLRSQRKEWSMDFVEGGEEALLHLQKTPVDIIISDMRMPKMDGAQLLNEVHRQAPATARLCLSGFSDNGMVLRGLNSIHQYLNKPCESNRLIDILRKILESAAALPDSLPGRLSGIPCLPVALATRQQMRKVLGQEEPSLDDLSGLVELDLGLSCRLVQLVHSGFFGTPRHLESIDDACRLLGVGNLRKLSETLEASSLPELEEEWLRGLGQRARQVSRRATARAREQGLSARDCENARVRGALYGLSELACAACGWPVSQAGADRFLMNLWGLPAELSEPDSSAARIVGEIEELQ